MVAYAIQIEFGLRPILEVDMKKVVPPLSPLSKDDLL